MRRLPRLAACLAACLAMGSALGLVAPALAQAPAQQTHGQLVEACLKDLRAGLRPGQKLTAHQRMQAEEQCNAHAKAAAQAQPAQSKR